MFFLWATGFIRTKYTRFSLELDMEVDEKDEAAFERVCEDPVSPIPWMKTSRSNRMFEEFRP